MGRVQPGKQGGPADGRDHGSRPTAPERKHGAAMNSVTLAKDGGITGTGSSAGAGPLKLLGHRVELEDDYRLASYFRMLEKHPVLMELSDFFPDYLEHYRACRSQPAPASGLDRLQFGKTVEMVGFPGEPRLEIFNTFYGVRGTDYLEVKNFQFGSLLDVPITLGGVKHIVFGDRMDIFEFDTVHTLFEFIDGIAWELSFQGAPAKCALRR
jgi:hypothetical protein